MPDPLAPPAPPPEALPTPPPTNDNCAVIAVPVDTVEDTDKLYVPVPPVPVPNDVIRVNALTPLPTINWPIANVPDETAVTVRTVVAIVAVNATKVTFHVVFDPAAPDPPPPIVMVVAVVPMDTPVPAMYPPPPPPATDPPPPPAIAHQSAVTVPLREATVPVATNRYTAYRVAVEASIYVPTTHAPVPVTAKGSRLPGCEPVCTDAPNVRALYPPTFEWFAVTTLTARSPRMR